MRLSELSGTASFAEIEKSNRLLSSLMGPSATSAIQMIIDQRAKQDRMLRLPSMMEQIITGQERANHLASFPVLDQIARQQRIFHDLTRRTMMLQALVTDRLRCPRN